MRSQSNNSHLNYHRYHIIQESEVSPDTVIFRLSPINGGRVFSFKAGQYSVLRIPSYITPSEEHTFSIASSPRQQSYLEYCVKRYGNWKTHLFDNKPGDFLDVAGPMGECIWEEDLSNVVFMIGGIGISAVISMLRYIAETDPQKKVTLLYGNRTAQSIAYKDELERLNTVMKNLSVIHILSDIPKEDPWQGYRGFITEDILKKEVDLKAKPTFYLIGPLIFLEKMNMILAHNQVGAARIRQEKV